MSSGRASGTRRDARSAGRRHRRATRALSRTVVLLLALLLGAFAGAGVASAHNVLTGSDPANGATVDTAPTSVTLTFDQPIQNLAPVLVVTGPNGNVFTTAAPTIDGNVISAPLGPAGPSGTYRIAYRIVSADGHPVTGEVTYTLAGSGAGTATGATPSAGVVGGEGADDGSGPGSGAGGLGGWLWLGLGVAAVLVVVAVAIALRRPRRTDG